MPWRGASEPGAFPTLGWLAADFIEARCVIPDGEMAGAPFLLTDEMVRFLVWFYRLVPIGKHRARWYYGRGGQLCRPQKWGKGPFSAAVIVAEAWGPVLFDGWDAAGEPVGRPWATPEIQITAISEDQTSNVWRALQPMVELGDLAADIPDTGLTRINLPDGGLIRPVTASARSRLGQRITFAVEDQTESWVESNHGRELADNQRRNLGGMKGRFLETPNAWDPTEDSVAQQTCELREPGVFFDDVEPGAGSVRNQKEVRRMLREVYGDSMIGVLDPDTNEVLTPPWIDPDRIALEIKALVKRDAAQAERWYLNRKEAGEAKAFKIDRYKELALPRLKVPKRTICTVGVDGARWRDALAIVGTCWPDSPKVATAAARRHQWTIGIWEKPSGAPDDYQHPFDEIDGAMLDVFDEFYPWRVYVDPQYIDYLLEKWQGRWGKDRVLPWFTNRPKQIAWGVRNFTDGMLSGDFTNDGDPKLTRHIGNAVKRKVQVFDDDHVQMHTLAKVRADSPLLMDGAMASTLSWEASGDAIAEEATAPGPAKLITFT
jgi:hypothetical protein